MPQLSFLTYSPKGYVLHMSLAIQTWSLQLFSDIRERVNLVFVLLSLLLVPIVIIIGWLLVFFFNLGVVMLL